jgi:hypothetical protein
MLIPMQFLSQMILKNLYLCAIMQKVTKYLQKPRERELKVSLQAY